MHIPIQGTSPYMERVTYLFHRHMTVVIELLGEGYFFRIQRLYLWPAA